MSNDPGRVAREERILGLLNDLGDRLIRSEKERAALKGRLARYEEVITALENSDRNRRVWQQRVEKELQAQTEKLRRAEAITQKIEEAMAQQKALNRKLEQITQERARMARKLERIEESVLQTREALEAKALVLLTDSKRASKTEAPQLPAAPEPDIKKRGGDVTGWWRRTTALQTAGVSALVLIAIFSGWAISRLPYNDLSPQAEQLASVETKAGSVDAVPEPIGTPPPAPEISGSYPQEDPAAAALQDITEDAGLAADPLFDPMSDQERLAAFAEDPDRLAAKLNEIEPDALPPGDKAVADEPAGSGIQVQETPPTAPAVETAPAVSEPGIEAFIDAQKDNRPLAERIQPDANLPSVIKEIEKKAFEGVPEAQHDLAAIYTAGHGNVTVDYDRAAQWFREAAIQGVANARYNLGVLYHQGLGVEKDIEQAVGWYRAAAQVGHPEAQYNLGIAHIEGVGAIYNPRLAAQFFEQAANAGIVEAAYNLGLIHENGLLGAATPRQALVWYKRAADQGNPQAKTALDQLAKALEMKPQDIDAILTDGKTAPPPPAKPAPQEKKADITPPAKKERASPYPKVPVSAAAPQEVTYDQAVIAQIQEHLVRQGLFPGPADGLTGPQTEDAIRSYQTANGLDPTGLPSRALLVHMMAGDLGPVSSAPPPPSAGILPGGLNPDDMAPPPNE